MPHNRMIKLPNWYLKIGHIVIWGLDLCWFVGGSSGPNLCWYVLSCRRVFRPEALMMCSLAAKARSYKVFLQRISWECYSLTVSAAFCEPSVRLSVFSPVGGSLGPNLWLFQSIAAKARSYNVFFRGWSALLQIMSDLQIKPSLLL